MSLSIPGGQIMLHSARVQQRVLTYKSIHLMPAEAVQEACE